MDFTREPIIETVVTPREGCKLVLRNSKNPGQEEYFVDALEVVSFGEALFYRSLERPKAFLLPVTDYEVLEVRETRMVLKNVGIDKTIKIGRGRESTRGGREEEKGGKGEAEAAEPRVEKKRDRRRSYRRRRGREDAKQEEENQAQETPKEKKRSSRKEETEEGELEEKLGFASPSFSSLLPPPPKLISETIEKYKNNEMYSGAFFESQEDETAEAELRGEDAEEVEGDPPALTQPEPTEDNPQAVEEGTLPFEFPPKKPPTEEDLLLGDEEEKGEVNNDLVEPEEEQKKPAPELAEEVGNGPQPAP